MRRRTALAWVALGLVTGSLTGVGLRSELPLPVVEPSGPRPTAVATTAAGTARSPSPARTTRSFGRDNLVSLDELEAAGFHPARTSATISSDEADPVVSPCQQDGPFSGLDDVVVARWPGQGGRAGEVVAQASSVEEARRRAGELYEQHQGCGALRGRTAGARHAIAVDGGSVTWFEVTQAGRTGVSAVLRQSNRFAVVYVDDAQVMAGRLPGLLKDASADLR